MNQLEIAHKEILDPTKITRCIVYIRYIHHKMILLYLTVNGSQLRIVCNHGYVHSLNMSYNLELLSPPSPSHRQWRTGRVCTVRSVTGGRWESASTRCCSGRHHSTPSLSWRPMARSCNTRCSIFCVRSLMFKFCGDD